MITNYLLDTNVIINHLKGIKPLPTNIDNIQISVITYAELLYGAKKSKKRKSLDILQEFLKTHETNYININKEVINQYILIKIELEEKGTPLDDFNLLIAATAKINNFTLITYNVKHFSRVPGLKLLKE